MDLLLWRHADAADGSPDLARPLTERGHKQARAVAGWLRKRLPARLRVLTSPARRARETAAALGLPVEVLDELAPNAAPSSLIAAAGWPDAPHAVLIVGHQPTLGETAAAILGREGREVPVRTGAVLWIRSPRQLVTVMEPEMLLKGDV
jgi:phosphohistidine phosphatase